MTTISGGKMDVSSLYKDPFIYKGILFGAFTSTEILQRCEQFQFRTDDVVVATYPRSGTTLTQEIVWQIVNHDRVGKDEQYGPLTTRFPFLEFNMDFSKKPGPQPIDVLEAETNKRLIKTHLPFSFLQNQFEKVNPKMIVVMRNPKDNVVSCYNFFKGLQVLHEDIEFQDYCDAYMGGKARCGDFCDLNLQWWALRNCENVLIVRFEDIVHQSFQQVRTIASFLGYSLSEDKIAAIAYNTTFDSMKKNQEVNVTLFSGKHQFLRKGKTGDWKTWLTVAQNEAMDNWIDERLSGSGLRFTYD